jgi:hypothetical protein
MNGVNQQLSDYIVEQIKLGVSLSNIKGTLLQNDWSESVIDDAISNLAQKPELTPVENLGAIPDPVPTDSTRITANTFDKENITMDKIIEKFIPIAGALLLVVGFGYLIYANAWVNLSMEIRLIFGFFFSLVIIGGSFSFSEKMKYFADIGIGSGILLLYGTLIYGSRTTEAATAMIPEVVTLFTAIVFTIAISYFASKRNSKVILILGMIGAYITPFVIGQNNVWVDNISFNAYLIYFFAINVSVFLIGREISVKDIIPLNLIGLFVGVTTLWGLSNSNDINAIRPENFFSGEVFTAVLFLGLVVFSIWSVLLSASKFKDSDDGYLSLGYIAPIVWFIFNINNLTSLGDILVGTLYAIISVSCFAGWHALLNKPTKFQHTALYAAGIITAFLAIVAFFKEFDVYTSILLAYSSLIFAFLYLARSQKSERFISYIVVSAAGAVLSIFHILEAELALETILIVIALLPAIAAYFIAINSNGAEYVSFSKTYSFIWTIIASMFVLAEFIEYFDLSFLLFFLAPLVFLLYIAYTRHVSPDAMSHDDQSKYLRLTMYWFGFGFLSTFFYLVSIIYPAPTDTFILNNTSGLTDWVLIKGVFATIILFVGLMLSRQLQTQQVIKRPSFILVIFGFSTLLLTGNYIIYALMNDFQVSMEQGGPRAIATTLWWVSIAIYMLYVGVRLGKKYHAEKLLGLILLGICLTKVILYDISTMDMQNKIIIMMMVGGAMLLFSYFIRSKNLIKTE